MEVDCSWYRLQSYLIGLWFSLRTHASQIWQNPQQLMHAAEMPLELPNPRISLYQRLIPGTLKHPSLHRRTSVVVNSESAEPSRSQTPVARAYDYQTGQSSAAPPQSALPTLAAGSGTQRRISYANPPVQYQPGMTPLLESVDHAMRDPAIQPLQLPGNITPDDFTRAVAVATVSALRHQQAHAHSPARHRLASEPEGSAAAGGGHGGHEGPSWSRTTSASVLLGCTALYAAIAGAFRLIAV